MVLDVMSGRDPLDGTTIERDEMSYTNLTLPIKGQKVGFIKEYMTKDLDPDVKQLIEAKIEQRGMEG